MPIILEAIHLGEPHVLDTDAPWVSSIFKQAVATPVWLGQTNLRGDRQADLAVHGGRDKAVCVYASTHYSEWRKETGIAACGPGWFGENFTLSGLTEQDIAIGDVFSVGEGDAVVEVSQPRSPCWKLGRRWQLPDMPKRVVHSGRTGWYFRVRDEGLVRPGDRLERLERPHAAWTIERVNAVTYGSGVAAADLERLRQELADVPALSEAWRSGLAE